MAIVASPASSEMELLGLLVDHLRDLAIFLLDVDGRIVTWNDGARHLKGYVADEIIGRHFSTFYTPEDIDRGHPAELLRAATEQGTIEELGWRLRKDGTRFWADVIITAVRDEAGRLRGFGKVTRDLSERRAAEEALHRSEENWRLLVESVREYGIIMLDVQGRVTSWNVGAERIKGYHAEEVLGKHASIFYPPDRREHFDELLAKARVEGSALDQGWRVRKDGTNFWADVVLTAVKDEHGLLRGFAKVTRDLTDRRAAEQGELHLAQTREALRLRDEFLSIASHELKTPITSLQLHLMTLQRALQKDPGASTDALDLDARLKKALRQVHRMGGLIESLLDVSRIVTGRWSLSVEEADLSKIAREAIEDMREAADRAGCTLNLRIAPDVRAKGRWDALHLAQVVSNMLDNAIKYGRERPVEIDVSSTDIAVRLSVTDHGIGFPENERERIFQRFERAVSARHFGGLGLGLYISREVIEAHGGRMSAQSEPGVATTFFFELPYAPSI